MYVFPLGQIIKYHNADADDTQIYIPLRPGDPGSLAAILDCLKDVNSWMAQNFSQLNSTKTEIILFTPPNNISHYQQALVPSLST